MYLGGELLCDLWVVCVSGRMFSQGHHDKQLEELFLLQLDEVPL